MRKVLLLVLTISSLTFFSCSSDDDSSENEYPKTVNIKFDVTTTSNTEAIITTTLNNDTQIDTVDNLPYSLTLAQEVVNQGTYLKLTFLNNLVQSGSTIDYDVELKISIGNEVVKTQTFAIIGSTGVVQIDYTFN